MPLTQWFLTFYFVSQDKRGVSAVARMSMLGTTYKTAWYMLKRIRAAMGQRDKTHQRNGTIEFDDNGYLTGRKVGGSGTNLGLEVLNGKDQDGNRFNYVIHTRDGKIFRSSPIYFRDDNDKVIGSLCVNLDITGTVRFENFLKEYNQYDLGSSGETAREEVKEIFVDDVPQIMDFLFNDGIHLIGCCPEEMNREQKMEFLRFLDKKGAFLISKANKRVCEFLQISKFTLYNYLDTVCSGREEK